MASLLLIIIYLTFISLGLPDALLGGGWPVMQVEFGVHYGFVGLVSMIITAGLSMQGSTPLSQGIMNPGT